MRARPAAAGGRGGAAALTEGGLTIGRFDYENDPFLRLPESCWPDYVVR
jgi:hypothetical protein